MAASPERRAFMLLHWTLGLGLLALTVQTSLHEFNQQGHLDFHLGMLVTVETLGALLFLIPRTLRLGGALLLLAFAGGFVLHATHGEWALQLLIYAAGVSYVMVHGAAHSPASDVAA